MTANFDVNEYLRLDETQRALTHIATSLNAILNGVQLLGAHGEALGTAKVAFSLLVFPAEGEQVQCTYRDNFKDPLRAAMVLRMQAAQLAPIPIEERMKQIYHLLESDKGASDIRAAIEAYLETENGHDSALLMEYWAHGRWAFRQGLSQDKCPNVEATKRRFWLNGWLAEEQR